MYGYGRVYRSMMGQRHISLQKIVEKFNIENKNICILCENYLSKKEKYGS
jgi:hypothetical protein